MKKLALLFSALLCMSGIANAISISIDVGDRGYYVDLPADSAVRPFVRTRNGRQQLVLPVAANAITKPIVYTLVW